MRDHERSMRDHLVAKNEKAFVEAGRRMMTCELSFVLASFLLMCCDKWMMTCDLSFLCTVMRSKPWQHASSADGGTKK